MRSIDAIEAALAGGGIAQMPWDWPDLFPDFPRRPRFPLDLPLFD